MNNKTRIMECAMELFYERGYDGVSVQEIVDAAGVTKPTLYHYFHSKYGLLEALLEYYYEDFRQGISKTLVYEGDLPMNLLQVAQVYFSYVYTHQHFYMLLMSMMYSGEGSESFKAVQPIMNEQFVMLRDLFLAASDKVGNMRGRQDQYATGFTGVINHYILYWFKSAGGKTPIGDDQAYSVVHQFLHGIYS